MSAVKNIPILKFVSPYRPAFISISIAHDKFVLHE
jgi:hypothetical protein